jgi:hypothetical protein
VARERRSEGGNLRKPHSIKQILAFQACPRGWAAKNLFACDDPKNAFAQDGIDGHAACESWLKSRSFNFERRTKGFDGVWRSEAVTVTPESHIGKLAKAAVAFAPEGALPEMDQAFELFGRPVECHIDCLWPDWSEFADWKFTSGYRDLTEATLQQDVQAHFQSYGMCKGSGQASIKGLWVYVNKKTYKAKPVRGAFSKDASEAWLRERVLPTMQLIELFSDLHERGLLTNLQQVPHDITACDGTGRFCNFLGRCQMKPSTGATLLQLRSHK